MCPSIGSNTFLASSYANVGLAALFEAGIQPCRVIMQQKILPLGPGLTIEGGGLEGLLLLPTAAISLYLQRDSGLGL